MHFIAVHCIFVFWKLMNFWKCQWFWKFTCFILISPVVLTSQEDNAYLHIYCLETKVFDTLCIALHCIFIFWKFENWWTFQSLNCTQNSYLWTYISSCVYSAERKRICLDSLVWEEVFYMFCIAVNCIFVFWIFEKWRIFVSPNCSQNSYVWTYTSSCVSFTGI